MLKIFNVNVTINDLFSRCRACNTGSYTLLTGNQARALWLKCKSENPSNFNEADKFVEKKKATRVSPPPAEEAYQLDKDEDLVKKICFKTYCLHQYPDVRVQLESIFDTTLLVVDIYYVCNGCGHIYWVSIPRILL